MAESTTPAELGYRWPAEWEPHAGTWLSWAHNQNSWPGKFEPVPAIFAEFARQVALFEPVNILATGDVLKQARELLAGCENIRFHDVPTNDCWIRDHGPWFLTHPERGSLLVDWEYNAWGGKYPPFDSDNAVPDKVARILDLPTIKPGLIMEGGSVENNGAGTLLVTSQCLLNPNRNADSSREEIEDALCEMTGAEQVLWLFDADDESLAGDDTDAHIDQLARFVSPTKILAMWTDDKNDPNYPLLKQMHEQLAGFRDLEGRPFKIIKLPLPEPVIYDDQQLPASYANFYIANGVVIVPTFRCEQDQTALRIIGEAFPDREIVGIDAVDLVWGLGAFHCASMQQAAG